ncbi:unnamed protein product [Brassicogethes aeneus]|uniref:Uncharacterized protein n=1 Tax=Brassicogethes aeneus TaxID=1431903 RepID=A0A9P0B472_BRAAE|nr:unnamed protein product [Brassicogethes aeneus]
MLLRLVCDPDSKKSIWQNPRPPSRRYCKPLKITFVKESNEIFVAEKNRVMRRKNEVLPKYPASEKSKMLSSFYTNLTSIKNEKPNRAVVWADAEELVKAVIKKINHIGKPENKIMADGGQGLYIICLTILPENYSSVLKRGLAGNQEIVKDELNAMDQRKRSTYKERGRKGKRGKSGVQKTAIATYPCPYRFQDKPTNVEDSNYESQTMYLRTYGDVTSISTNFVP